jgi:hypothetical protein
VVHFFFFAFYTTTRSGSSGGDRVIIFFFFSYIQGRKHLDDGANTRCLTSDHSARARW